MISDDAKVQKAIFPHLEEVKESNKRCFSNLFLPVPEEEPAGDAGVQQLWVLLGQGGQVEPLLTAVPTAEERLLRFVGPGRPCRTKNQRTKWDQLLLVKDFFSRRCKNIYIYILLLLLVLFFISESTFFII